VDYRIVVHVFEWKGAWNVSVDRVYPSGLSRYQRRSRVHEWRLETGVEMDEASAYQFLASRMQEAADRLH
jgi:hypothetical protein